MADPTAKYFMDDEREKDRLMDKVDPAEWVGKYIQPVLTENGQVLEVGCGPGVLLKQIAVANPSVQVTGLDLSKDRLAQADANFSDVENARTEQGDAHQLTFPDDGFDLVYSRFLLEYLRDKQVAISEMVRVLRPGGRLLLQDLDGQLAWHFPVDRRFQQDIEKTLEYLAQSGFDPFVGRKLYSYCHQIGLDDIEVAAESYHLYAGAIDPVNEKLWELKLDIALPAMESALGDRRAALRLKNRFMDYLRDEQTLTYSVLFSVTGTKPFRFRQG